MTVQHTLGGRPGLRILGIIVAGLFLAQGSMFAAGGSEESSRAGETQEETSELRIGYQPLAQTDPALISADVEVMVANQVYDYLVDINEDNEIVPRLGREWEQSEDGRTYVIRLAEGVTFHDGSRFTAEDVVWTYNRLRDPDNGFATASLYNNIDTIEATGEHEVTFHLKEPNPFFLFDLSDNHALMLNSGQEDPGTAFNGTGPYEVEQYLPEDRIVLTKNEDYFREGLPKLDRIVFIFFNDEAAKVDALRSERVDLAMQMPTELYESLEGESGIVRHEVATNAFDLVRLRADREPGDDPRVMRALRLATDRQAIFDLVLQGHGAIGRDSPVGPTYTQYYTEETELPGRDVQRARELLADAGYPNGFELDLHTPNTGNRPNLAAVLKDQWEDIGVEINIQVEPESVYYGENQWLEANLGITGWGSRPYPQFYLDVMLACGARWNEAHYCNEELDRLIETAGTSTDESRRVEAYHEIQRIMIEEGPLIIPYFFAQFAAITDEFEGFTLNAFPGRSDLRTVEKR